MPTITHIRRMAKKMNDLRKEEIDAETEMVELEVTKKKIALAQEKAKLEKLAIELEQQRAMMRQEESKLKMMQQAASAPSTSHQRPMKRSYIDHVVDQYESDAAPSYSAPPPPPQPVQTKTNTMRHQTNMGLFY